MSDHLLFVTSDRGFDAMPALPGVYGGSVQVYESSAAAAPHVWLATKDQSGEKVCVHLTAEDAWKLAEQLRYLVEHHYQGDARPDGAR